MRTTDLRHGLAALFVAPLLFAACASSNPPPDPGPPPPVPTETQAAVTTAAPSAEPTMAPVATAEPTAAPVASVEPTAAPTASATAAASGPANANLRVGSMTVDGLTLEDLACHADGLGLLGSMIVVGSISKKKTALNACGKGKVRVEWTASKGTVSAASAKSENAKVDACVAKVLKGTQAPFEGECAATLVLGK